MKKFKKNLQRVLAWHERVFERKLDFSYLRRYFRDYKFKIGLAIFLLIAVMLGEGYSYLNRKLAERPGEVLAAPGDAWSAQMAAQPNIWTSVTYGNGLFVAVARASNQIMTSPNGITWTARSVPEANNWMSVTYGNGLFVAVAGSGINRVMTSPDGITWTARSAAEANTWMSVIFGNGLFVAVSTSGINRVMTSPDGITWTARSAAEANMWISVTYGNGLFVGVARSGINRVMTSPDGIAWTARTAAEANEWNSVTYGNNLFVAVSIAGTNRVMTSPDGITWTARSAAEANIWSSVTYGNGLFVAVSSSGTNRVMTSPDGITWTARSAPEANSWSSVTYGNGIFVAVAGTGINRVMISPPFDFSLSNSGNVSVNQGGSVTNTITATLVSGPSQAVTFSTSGLPAGASAAYAPASVNPTGATTMTIDSGTAAAGTYTITVTGTGGSVTSITQFTLTVNAPTFNYSLTNSGNISVVRGGSVNNTITATLVSGSTETVTFSATGPAGTTFSFSPPTRQPTAGGRTSTLTITTSAATPVGVSVITARGTSSPSSVVRTTTFNLTVTDNPPTVPTGLSAVAASSSQINLSWNAASDTDATPVAGYKIFRNGVQVGTSAITTYSDTGLAPLTTYNYTVSAYDTDTPPRESAQSSQASAATLDAPPTAPAGLTGTVISSRRVSLSWGASTDPDATPLTGYQVFRNGSQIASLGLVTSYLDTTVAPATSYNYTVKAIDSAGTLSSDSDAFAAVTFDPLLANVRGWAWNQGTGWVSFNSDYINPIALRETESRLAKNGRRIYAVAEVIFGRLLERLDKVLGLDQKFAEIRSSARKTASLIELAKIAGIRRALAQADIDFGVNLATTTETGIFQFSGFAWSENVGWIYFGPDNDFTLQGYGDVSSSTAPSEPRHWARFNSASSTDNVTGWAKILALGDEGWIKMSDSSVGVWAGKGINLTASGTDLIFTGWGWNSGSNGSPGIGWVSFNAESCDTEGGAPNGFLDTVCDGDNATTPLGQRFRVVATGITLNQPPSVTAADLTAPNWNFTQANTLGALGATLSWVFSDPDGDSQAAYRIIINTSNSTSSPVFDSGTLIGSASSFQLNSSYGWFTYNTPYYWWLEVVDSNGATTTVQYNSPADTDNDDANPLTFTTYKHEFPDARFDWLPKKPSRDEDVNFFDQSLVYLTAAPDTPVNATTSNATWLWTFNNGTPATSNDPNPTAQFNSSGSTIVTLQVTDTDGYYSSTSTSIDANLKLPTWQERKPD